MTDDRAISRSVLAEQVKDRLLQDILAGRYPSDARIVETRVARELGTSQAPVREALRREAVDVQQRRVRARLDVDVPEADPVDPRRPVLREGLGDCAA